MSLLPFQQFIPDDKQCTFMRRTYHREDKGGYEAWSFNIDNQNYLIEGDVRRLPVTNERAVFITLYKEIFINNIPVWDATWDPGSQILAVLKKLTEIIFRIQVIREFRYITIHTCPGWDKHLKLFLKKIAQPISDQNIITEVFTTYKPEIQISIDAGFSDFIVGDIYTNPGFIFLNSSNPDFHNT
jgi:hypothetical protein